MKARIVYMGTPEFAVAPLEALVHSQHEVVAVVTVPDRQAGRGRKPTPSAVKLKAEELNIPVLQPEKLRDPEFRNELRSFDADIFVVVAFRMLPESIWKMPPKGTFNLHASLLPDYRGAAPIHWAVINGEEKTGVTTFLIDEEIDTGNIILQSETSIGKDETTGSLYHRLMELGSPLVVETADRLMEGNVHLKPQKDILSPKSAPKLFREHQYVDLAKGAEAAHNRIRGLTPFPSALLRLTLEDETFEVKVSDSHISQRSPSSPGTLHWEKNTMLISTSDGVLEIDSIQWPGKRKMSVEDFKNGFPKYSGLKVVYNP